ncbi:MAG: hypothetical protein ABL957_03830 [Parvularculaceae bacterium]
MSFRKLLEAFEGEETLPVPVDRIAKWLMDNGIQDEIDFVGVDLDTGVIRGFLHRFTYHKVPYGAPVMCANIYYARNQDQDWINLVCAKELIHMMDKNHRVTKKEQFDTLISRLVLPRELKVLLEDPAYALSDKFGDAFAAAILLPLASRSLLIEPYKNDEVTAADIALVAEMPVHYVRLVMSDEWPAAYERMKTIGETAKPPVANTP